MSTERPLYDHSKDENRQLQKQHDTPEVSVSYLRKHPTSPVRILISTTTRLVPGNGYFERTEFIRNLVSQYHWKRDFEWGLDRFDTYNAKFGYDYRKCYFLIDHGESPDGNDSIVPIPWYRWTGESL